MPQSKIVAVDFDGTIVEHKYPEIGPEVPEAINTLHALQGEDVRIILWTMRSGKTLDDAVEYLAGHDIHPWGINQNPDQIESGWSTSPKAYAQLYIDDAALGCPLIHHMTDPDRRPYVDWYAIRERLVMWRFL